MNKLHRRKTYLKLAALFINTPFHDNGICRELFGSANSKDYQAGWGIRACEMFPEIIPFAKDDHNEWEGGYWHMLYGEVSSNELRATILLFAYFMTI